MGEFLGELIAEAIAEVFGAIFRALGEAYLVPLWYRSELFRGVCWTSLGCFFLAGAVALGYLVDYLWSNHIWIFG